MRILENYVKLPMTDCQWCDPDELPCEECELFARDYAATHSQPSEEIQEILTDNAEQVYGPTAVTEPELGQFGVSLTNDEHLEQNEFPIEIAKFNIPEGGVVSCPMVYPAMKDVNSDDSTENAITQNFERAAERVLSVPGSLGPVVGNYTLNSVLPTDVVARVSHVALPGDMNDLAALTRFGFGNVLDIAGAGLNVLGGVFGGVVDLASNLLGGLVGIGGDTSTQQSIAGKSVGGEVPVARFISLLNDIAGNQSNDPVFGTLLMAVDSIIGLLPLIRTDENGVQYAEEPKLPISVFTNLIPGATAARSIWDRITSTGLLPESVIPVMSIPSMLETMTSYMDDHQLRRIVRASRAGMKIRDDAWSKLFKKKDQYENFIKFYTHTKQRLAQRQYISIESVLAYEPTESEVNMVHAQLINSYVM